MFQVHIKPLLNKKGGGSKSPLKSKVSDTAAEFIVGPGATFKRQAPAPVQHKQLEKSSYLGSKGSKFKPVSDSYHKPETFETVVPTGRDDSSDQKGSPEKGKPTPVVIGKQQMQVISELLERGTVLRDKMVHSLAAGTQLDQLPRYMR